MKPLKRSVALVVREDALQRRTLLVRRPPDDDDLPGVWGLPAASLQGEEGWEDAVRRAAREKLGVVVQVGELLHEGSALRDHHELHMRLYAARLVAGEARVDLGAGDPDDPATTRYVDWCWGDPTLLRPAAERGSLCARLYLETDGTRPAEGA